MPSPSGEGQTDTPINHRNQGEVMYNPLKETSMTGRIEKTVLISDKIRIWKENSAKQSLIIC